jgi:hypothetical protein
MFAYPRGRGAWDSAEELISSSNLEFDEIAKLIDPYSASDELFSHIFFEKFLELYEGHKTPEELVELGKKAADQGRAAEPRLVNWQSLFEYCDHLFGKTDLKTILTTAYMFRVPILKSMPSVLLSNANLVSFLESLSIEAKHQSNADAEIDSDAIAWEFFRQIVSLRLDPIDEKRIEMVGGLLLTKRPDEIDALKRRCVSLAMDLGAEKNLSVLQKKITQHIRAKVEGDVQSLLSLNKTTGKEFLDSVFSDEKAWIGIASFIYSLAQGSPMLTAGAAIYALGNIGSKGVKAAADRRKKLEVSDCALLYRMNK